MISPWLSLKHQRAQPLQLDVGTLEHFPDGMRAFSRTIHDGIVLDDVRDFKISKGHRDFNYKKCGRKAWKLTREVQTFIIRRLLALRRNSVCTSQTLQQEVMKEKSILVETSAIRKLLKKRGYKWLPRSQEPIWEYQIGTNTRRPLPRCPAEAWGRRVVLDC